MPTPYHTDAEEKRPHSNYQSIAGSRVTTNALVFARRNCPPALVEDPLEPAAHGKLLRL
jgi:hypothetical protein